MWHHILPPSCLTTMFLWPVLWSFKTSVTVICIERNIFLSVSTFIQVLWLILNQSPWQPNMTPWRQAVRLHGRIVCVNYKSPICYVALISICLTFSWASTSRSHAFLCFFQCFTWHSLKKTHIPSIFNSDLFSTNFQVCTLAHWYMHVFPFPKLHVPAIMDLVNPGIGMSVLGQFP